jgi:hypothetical protein
MDEMRFDGGGEEAEHVAALLAAGFDHRQYRLGKPAVGGALRSKRQLSPDDRATQRPLASVVRRRNPTGTQKN